ncbi:MAG TPA: hypothetical protein VEV38_07860 [Candidatus Eremiobacteraceae bacterium]|nr:hypothetical protein [Candidatus Eremiobacteraceae bacterium]
MLAIIGVLAAASVAMAPSQTPASPSPSPAAAAPVTPAPAPKGSPKPKASPTPSTPYAALEWREVGPAAAGGRVAAVAGSVNDPFLYYIGAAGGGVWKTDNGGQTWSSVFDDQDTQSIGAVTIAPSDDKTVWVGTGETNPRNDVILGDGIFKSTDGGDSWKKMGLDELHSISRIVVDPANVDHVIAGGIGNLFKDSPAGGIYVTSDGGKTWTHSLYVGPSSGASDIAIDPKDANVVYAGIWQFRRLPWTATSGGPDDGLYKSTDGGKTFTKLTGHGLPTGLQGRIALAVSRSDPNRVYALIQSKQGFLFRSDDAGANWTMVNDNTLIDQRPFYFSHIAVDPTNKDRVVSVSMFPAVSKDGGKTFKEIASDIHPDYHAVWIAPDNPKRMIVGQDGGAMVTNDGGENWFFSRNYAIAQIYHVGIDQNNPYTVCGGMQDNSGWCWPSNSLDADGITNSYAFQTVGGDGVWVVPDPGNPDYIWGDSEDGAVSIWMLKEKRTINVFPDLGGFNGFDYGKDKYRFDWDSPIAFAPWDPHTVWYGGNVVFQSQNEGKDWTPISPDLTMNDKSKEFPSGGPINYDVSGAETYDTILDIEGSTRAKGEVWVGTDDGLVQLTRDGGKHWANVTPKGVPAWGRFEIVAPSTFTDGTAYAVDDRHYSGDATPYVFKTTDFGKSWTSISAGLPDQPARSIRQDLINPNLVYVGLEKSIWVSFNGGKSWKTLQAGLSHTAVFDIRLQNNANFDDLVIATHGRGAYIMDDIRPLQQLDTARAAGDYVFQPMPTYEYNQTELAEGTYTEYGAPNPPSGTVLYFYQAKPGKKPPVIDIYDAAGHRVRHVIGSRTNPTTGKKTPFVKNDIGLNRFVWNLNTDPITPWHGAANPAARQPGLGIQVVPGTYRARFSWSDGKVESRTFDVKADPQSKLTAADYKATYDFVSGIRSEVDGVNVALNSIDAQLVRLKKLNTPAATGAVTSGDALEKMLSANYKNEEDSIMWAPGLREDLQGVLFSVFGSESAPYAPSYRAAAILKPRYEKAMTQVSSWLAMAKAIK